MLHYKISLQLLDIYINNITFVVLFYLLYYLFCFGIFIDINMISKVCSDFGINGFHALFCFRSFTEIWRQEIFLLGKIIFAKYLILVWQEKGRMNEYLRLLKQNSYLIIRNFNNMISILKVLLLYLRI